MKTDSNVTIIPTPMVWWKYVLAALSALVVLNGIAVALMYLLGTQSLPTDSFIFCSVISIAVLGEALRLRKLSWVGSSSIRVNVGAVVWMLIVGCTYLYTNNFTAPWNYVAFFESLTAGGLLFMLITFA